jgi:hypothetical protein
MRMSIDKLTECRKRYIQCSGKFSAYTQTYKAQRIRGAKSEKFEIPQGIKQGDSLIPLLFITFMDKILKHCKRRKGKIQIGYWNMPPVYIQAFVYANNLAIMANYKGELQRAVTKWASACRERGMEINISNSKTMHIAKGIQRRLNNEWEGDRMEQVEETEYLGIIMSANGNN